MASSESLRLRTAGSVPGDLITDLQRGGHIGDPWFENNFRNSTTWARDWTYSRAFDVAAAGSPSTTARLIVFDGIKMGAEVRVNGERLGFATDQFLRYEFLLPATLRPTGNVLEVSFRRSIDTHGRFMGCSGGWWTSVTRCSLAAVRPGCPPSRAECCMRRRS